jgi:hypothetical protein
MAPVVSFSRQGRYLAMYELMLLHEQEATGAYLVGYLLLLNRIFPHLHIPSKEQLKKNVFEIGSDEPYVQISVTFEQRKKITNCKLSVSANTNIITYFFLLKQNFAFGSNITIL